MSSIKGNNLAVEIGKLSDTVAGLDKNTGDALTQENQIRSDLNQLNAQMQALSEALGVHYEAEALSDIDLRLLNSKVNDLLLESGNKQSKYPDLSATDCIVASLAGLLSVAIDVIFVGTPEVVKIYRGGENFDGSKLTALLREIKPGKSQFGHVLEWLSDKCSVPYDISVKKGVVIPNNHRLRGLAHDPFFGLFFAVADIIMGTTTCIDNNGMLRILPNYDTSMEDKLCSVFYFIGHIISDLFTARGIPVPGSFVTQFFTGRGKARSIAKIVEEMYLDGYDMRHLASMSVPVATKNIIIGAYCKLIRESGDVQLLLAETEIKSIHENMRKDKMLLISGAIASAGNLIKFATPPVCCNPCALNVTQWISLANSSVKIVMQLRRDDSAERVLNGREEIDALWTSILNESC